MSFLKIKSDNTRDFTMLPNEFVDNYMIHANPTFSLIYIYLFRHISNNSNEFGTEKIAEDFGILESDIIKALKYWESKELLKLTAVGDDLELELLPIKKAEEKKVINLIPDNRPFYQPTEIEVYKNESDEIRKLFEVAESLLGKYLSSNDMSTLFSFYDWLRMPIDVIEMLVKYCVENGHRSMNYMEKVAIDWHDNGIVTTEACEEHITKLNKTYKKIFKTFGITGRSYAPAEIEYMDRWLDTYKLPIDVILKACEDSLLKTGKASFSYAETILKSWSDQNVKSLEGAELASNKYREEKKAQREKAAEKRKSAQKAPVKKKNRIVNYTGRTWDYKKLEELEMQRLIAETEGREEASK